MRARLDRRRCHRRSRADVVVRTSFFATAKGAGKTGADAAGACRRTAPRAPRPSSGRDLRLAEHHRIEAGGDRKACRTACSRGSV
jgi:hypothetical protein